MLQQLAFGLGLCAMTFSSMAQARIRCGGCSDPCGRAYASQCGTHCAHQYAYNTCAPQYAAPAYHVHGPGCGHESVGYQSAGCEQVIESSGSVALDGSYVAQSQTNDTLPQTIESYQVVLEPQVVTEKQFVPTTEYQDEVRYSTRTVYRTVPVQIEDYRVTTVMVPKTETKLVEYTVLVPETTQKTIDTVESVPEWKETDEQYVVKVPKLVDVPEEYTVKIPTLRDEQFTYTVYVPKVETSTRVQTVTNAVPVTKTRMVNRPVPVTKTKTVTKDYGHWETVVEDCSTVSASTAAYPASNVIAMGGCGAGPVVQGNAGCGTSSACGSCGGCGKVRHSMLGRKCASYNTCNRCGGCGQVSAVNCGTETMVSGGCGTAVTSSIVPSTVSRQVWVPNVVTEEVQYVESEFVPQEISYTVYEQQSQEIPVEVSCMVMRPETRTAVKKVVDYRPETRTRMRKTVEYNDETRTRKRRELVYRNETKPVTYPVVTYRTEKKTKEVSFTFNVPETKTEPFTTTRYDQVSEDIVEQYTEKVPVTVMKEIQVQVVKMVPKVVPITINIGCAATSVSTGTSACETTTDGYLPSPCGQPVQSGYWSPSAVMNVVPSPCGCR